MIRAARWTLAVALIFLAIPLLSPSLILIALAVVAAPPASRGGQRRTLSSVLSRLPGSRRWTAMRDADRGTRAHRAAGLEAEQGRREVDLLARAGLIPRSAVASTAPGGAQTPAADSLPSREDGRTVTPGLSRPRRPGATSSPPRIPHGYTHVVIPLPTRES